MKARTDILEKAAVFFAAAVFCLLSVLISVGSGGARFLLYLLFWVMLPGNFFYRRLFDRAEEPPLVFLKSFYTGAAFLFLQYYLCQLFGTLLPLRFLPSVLAVFYLVERFFPPPARRVSAGNEPKRRPERGQGGEVFALFLKKDSRIRRVFRAAGTHPWVLAAAAVAALYSFYLLAVRFREPDSVFNPDYQWHMGNIYTLAEPGFRDIRVEGMTFRYHYFSDLFFAIGRVAVGLDPFDCVMRYPVLIFPVLLVFSVDALLKKAIKNAAARAAAILFFLFFFPLSGRNNDIAYQMFTNVNAVGMALPCGILLLLTVEKLFSPEGEKLENYPAAAVLMLLLAGLKGPFAVSVLGAAVSAAVYAVIKRRKIRFRQLAALGLLCFCFGMVWLSLLRYGFSDAYTLSDRLLMPVSHAEMLSAPIIALGDGLTARLVFLPVQFLLVTGVFGIPFIAGLCRLISGIFSKKRPEAGTMEVLCSLGALLSFGAYYTFDMIGRSQYYFLYFACPMAVYAAFREFDRWKARIRGKKAAKVIAAALGCVLLASGIFSAFHQMVEPVVTYYTADEMRAVEWIKTNIPDGSRVAINRHGAFYLASGYTGRRFFIEGVAYAKNSGFTESALQGQISQNDRLFHLDTPTVDRPAIARELRVEYVVQWLGGETDGALLGVFGAGFETCYAGSDVAVYRLLPE